MAIVQAMMLYFAGRLMAITAGAMGEETFYRLIKLATIMCIICVVAEPLRGWLDGLGDTLATIQENQSTLETIIDFLLMYPTGKQF